MSHIERDDRTPRASRALVIAIAWTAGCVQASAPPVAPASSPPTTSSADAETVRAAIARLDAASAAWEATCTRPGPHGLCITIVAPDTAADRCGARLLGRVDVLERSASEARKARTDLSNAIADTAGLADPEDRDLAQALHDARGRAAVRLADADLEAYLAVHVPAKLEFYVEDWKKDAPDPEHRKDYAQQRDRADDSMARFKSFYETKNELGSALIKAYAEVKHARSPSWTAEAALRTSWLSVHFSDELRSAPVSKSLRTPEMRDAYCEALDDQARGPERLARDAAMYCVERSKEQGVTSEATTACQELLARLPAADR